MPNLTILHTNDIHGRVTQLSKVASLVRNIRREVGHKGDHCLYVDAGDSEDTTMLESSLTKGSAMAAILRGAGCEYAALGNAIPVRYGHQAIVDLARYFGRPLLCANMFDQHGTIVNGLQPMTFETFDGLKVAIIGLTAPVPAYTTFFKLQIGQPARLLPGLISEAKAQGAKTIIILSHLGSKDDLDLASQVQAIDVIVGAHDHRELYPPAVVNGTVIVQAGDFGRLLGRLDLKLDAETGRVLEFQGELIPVTEDTPLDQATQEAYATQQKRIGEMMNREIGCLNEPFDLSDERECAAGNLLADALLDRMEGAELALILAGHWESGLEAGRLSQAALFAANRSTANPAKATLTGAQIIQFLRSARRPENRLRKLHSLRGRAVGAPHVAGAVVHCAEDSDEIIVEINGRSLDLDQTYVVASTDMEFSEYIGYLVIPDEQVQFEVPTIMPEALQEYILNHTPLERPQPRFLAIK
jgi:2',3'-cyclic-nucleotide 2'-phosphodiesterase (5'-nucleotidase family)